MDLQFIQQSKLVCQVPDLMQLLVFAEQILNFHFFKSIFYLPLTLNAYSEILHWDYQVNSVTKDNSVEAAFVT